MMGFNEILKGLTEVLTTPVSLTGRPLTPEESRRRRADKAKRRLSRGVFPSSSETRDAEIGFIIQGLIEAGSSAQFAIDQKDFSITPETWMLGKISIGAKATVKGIVNDSGKRIAKSVVITR